MNNLFSQLECLTEESKPIPGEYLRKNWFTHADSRYLAETLHKFIVYNRELFDFLGITPKIKGTGKDIELLFKTTHYIGAIPLRSPDTGTQIGDLVVTPRYLPNRKGLTDYIEIINLLEEDIAPEFTDSLPLKTNNNIKPPLYLEAIKFIKKLEEAIKVEWQKFKNIEKEYNYPKPEVNWDEYIKRSYDPEERLRYQSTTNTLTKKHEEFFQIKYAYQQAKKTINQTTTPRKIKINSKPRIDILDKKLYDYETLETNNLIVHNSDPPKIKELKRQGNKILERDSTLIPGWRINFSELYEKYVQHIFKLISLEIGGRMLENYRIRRQGRNPPAWSLHHLEPDIILLTDEMGIIADAKYKSHLLNYYSQSAKIKEEHRHDLHQILSYLSFIQKQHKVCILCYPSTKPFINELEYYIDATKTTNQFVLAGIPLEKEQIPKIKKEITRKIHPLKKENILEQPAQLR